MAEYLEAFRSNELLDLMIGRWNADYDDPDNFTHALFNSRTGRWRSWYSSPQADALFEEARGEGRPAIREGLYRKFEGLLQESAALVPLFHDIDYRLASPRVRGRRLRGTAPYVNYLQIGKSERPLALRSRRPPAADRSRCPWRAPPAISTPPRT
jgi:ABC-type oligopeptide transport system substrate-binding subunit